MMNTNYNFDEVIDRKGSGDIKHDALQELWGRSDLLPMWVADMDFATPSFIVDALKQRMEHPIFGYTATPEAYWQAIIDWVATHHQWDIRKEWLCYIPGIVKGIGFVVNRFTKPGDKVIIQTPVYHPFRLVPQENGREVVFNPLTPSYEMDFDNLAEVCDERCKVLILANPHNPIGICWSRETLERLADFCHDHHILVISDEIHCDMALFGHKHIPFASVSEKAADCSITFQAPTKTFNIAGIVSSYAIVPNDELRQKFFCWMKANEFDAPNIFAPIATIAAFTKGEEWRRQMLSYVEGNIHLVEDYCHEHMPQIKPIRPQASFLIWLDCRGLGLDHDALEDLFANKARLALNDGAMFGEAGSGFMRLNVGSPRSVVQQAMDQLREAVRNEK